MTRSATWFLAALCLSLTACRPTDPTRAFLAITDGVIPEHAITGVESCIESSRSGYHIVARLTVGDPGVLARIAALSEAGKVVAVNEADLRSWTLMSADGATATAVERQYGDLLSDASSWWDLSPTEPRRVYLQKGKNSWTHEYWHWWVLPTGPGRRDTVYLLGTGS